MGPNFMDELDCGSFFDNMDDLIEFPPDNDCGNGLVGSGDCKDFPSIWNEGLPDADNIFSGSNCNSASDLSAELSVPSPIVLITTEFANGGNLILYLLWSFWHK